MRRGAVAVLTGLCTAPLFGALSFWFADLAVGPGSGPDGSIANAYLVLLIGIVAALGGGIISAVATFWLPPRFRLHVVICSALLVVAMVASWQVFVAEPSPLEYDGIRPQLEAEIRLPQAFGGSDAVGAIMFSEGLLDSRHDDQIRTEGDFIILPWDTTPYRVKAWAIQILLKGHDNWTRFDLDLPKRPTQSTEWSPWLAASPGDDLDVVDGVTLRFRFRLIPYGQ